MQGSGRLKQSNVCDNMNRINCDRKTKYVMLTIMDGLGPVTANRLIESCGDIERCFELTDEEIITYVRDTGISMGLVKRFLAQRNEIVLMFRAKDIIDHAEKGGIIVVTLEDKDYPDRFSGLYDMPIVLYIKGRLRINEYSDSVGIVGARRCTHEGKKIAIELASKTSIAGGAVISGMAKGIDSYAHTAALKTGGYTIAVLGCGVDVCYPLEHQKLYDMIADRGCLLSEYPPGTSPRKYMFPRRNRLIAALSDIIYVIDAGRHSGTDSTAFFGREYCRRVEKTI